MSYSDLLNTTCNIYRLSGISGYDFSSSEEGEVDESWTEVASSVKCRTDRAYIRGSRQSGGFIKSGQRTLFLEAGVDIRLGDRILVDGMYYSVTMSDTIDGMRDPHHIEATIDIVDWEYSS